jgi:DNA polymerase-3 subunit alpha
VLESLAKAGALDSIFGDADINSVADGRARLLAAVDHALEHGNRRQRSRDSGQTELFGESDAEGDEGRIHLPKATPLTESEQLAFEKEALGLYLSGHPVDRFGAALAGAGVKRIEELVSSESSISVAGVIGQIRTLTTRKGAAMAVATLDDRGGHLETVVFPEAYAKYQSMIKADQIVIVTGKLDKDDETSRLIVTKIEPIETVANGAQRIMTVKLTIPPHTSKTIETLAELFGRHHGTGRVSLEIELWRDEVPIRIRADLSQTRIRASETLVTDVERLCGKGTVSWS